MLISSAIQHVRRFGETITHWELKSVKLRFINLNNGNPKLGFKVRQKHKPKHKIEEPANAKNRNEPEKRQAKNQMWVSRYHNPIENYQVQQRQNQKLGFKGTHKTEYQTYNQYRGKIQNELTKKIFKTQVQ